jgi:hypothetical protein
VTLIDMVLDRDNVARTIAMIDALLDSASVCAVAGISALGLKRLHARNAGPPYLVIGEEVFYRVSEVATWMAARPKASNRARQSGRTSDS